MDKVWLLMAYLNYVSILKCGKERYSFFVTFSFLNAFVRLLHRLSRLYSIRLVWSTWNIL